MEIAPESRRGRGARRLALAVLSLLALWLVAPLVVPTVLGFDTVVADAPDAASGVRPGAVLLVRNEASSQLAVGDRVVSSEDDGGSSAWCVGKVSAITPGTVIAVWPGGARTVVSTVRRPNVARVSLIVPAGFVPLAGSPWTSVATLGAVASAAAGILVGPRRRRARAVDGSGEHPTARPLML